MKEKRIALFVIAFIIQSFICKSTKLKLEKSAYYLYIFRKPVVKRNFICIFHMNNGRTFLTGIKPTGDIHLGNYIGCLSPIINVEVNEKSYQWNCNLKRKKEIKLNKIVMIADLHSLTYISNLYSLKENVLKCAKIIVALIINMYLKKRSYLDAYINDVRVEKIWKLLNAEEFEKTIIRNLLKKGSKIKDIRNYYTNCKKCENNRNKNSAINISKLSTVRRKKKQIHHFYLFRQSDIHYHTSMYYFINSFTSINILSSHVHIKNSEEKSKSLSLFSYPTLMLSDILLYKPDNLIVGIDQLKNLEILKKICKRMNKYFPNTFYLPKVYYRKFNMEIMDINGNKKMSKRKLPNQNTSGDANIYLFETKEELSRRLRKAKTDNLNDLKYAQENRKEINNLINIFCFFYYYKKQRCVHEEIKDDIFLMKKVKQWNNGKGKFKTVKTENDRDTSIIKNEEDMNSKVNAEKKDTFCKKHNIYNSFNAEVINHIILPYNNNYESFKCEIADLIYEHFENSKYIYEALISKNVLINKVLKRGKNILSKQAHKYFMAFQKKIGI